MSDRLKLKYAVFLNIAKEVSRLSRCKRLKVGACLVRDWRIVSTGFNGTPHGLDNDCECEDKTKPMVVHAEMNSILFAARHGLETNGCTLFVTNAPCFSCTRAIIQAGIVEVVYDEDYHTDGINLLKEADIKITKL